MNFLDPDHLSATFGIGPEGKLPKFACGLMDCCEKKKKCCKKYKHGKRCKSCPKA